MMRFLSYLFLLLFTLSVGNLCAQTADNTALLKELISNGKFKQAEKAYKERIRQLEKNENDTCIEYLTALNDLGFLYYYYGNLDLAGQYFTKAINAIDRTNNENNALLASILQGMSSVCADKMEYSLAIEYIEQALKIGAEVYGDKSEGYAGMLADAGTIYHNLSDYKKAEYYYKRAMVIHKSIGVKSLSYATLLNNYGIFILDKGDDERAKSYHLKALEIQKSIVGEQHVDYLLTLCRLAALDIRDNDLLAAEEKYNMVLATQEEILGKNNVDYAITLGSLGQLFILSGDYYRSKRCFLESANILKNTLGEHHSYYGTTLTFLGDVSLSQGDFNDAEKYYIQALLITKSVFGENHLEYADRLFSLADYNSAKGDFSTAIYYLQEAIKVEKSILGEENINYINKLCVLGVFYTNLPNYALAESTLLETMHLYEKTNNIENPDYAACLHNLSIVYQYTEAWNLAEKYLLKAQETYDKEDKNYANLLCDLGVTIYRNGDYSRARLYFDEALNRIDSSEEKETAAFIYRYLGDVYLKEGKYQDVIVHYSSALSLTEDNTLKLYVLKGLGDVYLSQYNFNMAQECFLSAIKVNNEFNPEDKVTYVTLLLKLATISLSKIDSEQAEVSLLESLKIHQDTLGTQNTTYIETLSLLSSLYMLQGRLDLAENYTLSAVKTANEIENYDKERYTNLLKELSIFYFSVGDYANSLQYCHQAYSIVKSLNINTSSTVGVLVLLGQLYTKQKDFAIAEQYLLESLSLSDSINMSDTTHSLQALAVLYLSQLDYEKSEKYFLATLDAIKKRYGTSHTLYAVNLKNVGMLYLMQGNYSKSKNYLLQSFKQIRNNLSSYNDHYAELLLSLGLVEFCESKYKSSEEYFKQVYGIYKELYVRSIDYMTEKQRNDYWNTIKDNFTYLTPVFSYRYHFAKPSISTFAYDNELFRKGLLLNSTDAVRRSILESGDSVLIEQWNELTEAKQEVMHLEEKEPTSNQLDIYRHRADSLEKIMTISSSAFRQSKEQWNINWERVKKQLSKNEVAIEYFSAPISKDSTMYCALLLRQNSKYPELIPLFEEKEIASYLDKATEGSTNNLYSFKGEGEHISNIVWSKILSEIKPGETIYFAPTGILHQLAIEYLPYDEQRTMSDVYNMVRLSSTREIVTNKSKESYNSAVTYGGIHYDLDNNTILTESNLYPGLKRSSLENDSINRGSAKFLPGTKEEAEKINKLLTDNKIEAIIYKTKSANEESFKSLSGKHNNILHIATHGFTWTDSTARKQDYFADRMKMQLMGDNQMRGPIIDPLDRCGLLFAGANTALQGKSRELPEGVQDGILTAKEISLMDLRDAELVVLSACETAKGDITSEGVFGLQRAFKMAGVQTIIMSLWKVSDEATQLLMSEFFTNWIAKKQPKREAFKNAQNTVRYAVDEYGDYIYNDKPYYWAGFVMLD